MDSGHQFNTLFCSFYWQLNGFYCLLLASFIWSSHCCRIVLLIRTPLGKWPSASNRTSEIVRFRTTHAACVTLKKWKTDKQRQLKVWVGVLKTPFNVSVHVNSAWPWRLWHRRKSVPWTLFISEVERILETAQWKKQSGILASFSRQLLRGLRAGSGLGVANYSSSLESFNWFFREQLAAQTSPKMKSLVCVSG